MTFCYILTDFVLFYKTVSPVDFPVEAGRNLGDFWAGLGNVQETKIGIGRKFPHPWPWHRVSPARPVHV